MPQKIIPFIRSNDNAAAMADYYLSIFPDAMLLSRNSFVSTIEVFGSEISTLQGWPNTNATLNPSISFSLRIKDEALTKQLWDKLSDGGMVMMPYNSYEWSPAYGWCNDKFWVSRQIMYDNRDTTDSHALVPSLMYIGKNNGKTAEAMEFYTTIFPDSGIDFTRPYGENQVWEDPTHLNHAEFKLMNQQFIAMDSGMDHRFQFNEGVSLCVMCSGQQEVDYFWNSLTANGGEESQCGWLKDKYWVSWQITPHQLIEAIFKAETPEKWQYAMNQMMKMKKIVIEDLYQK